jgi:hypothetical protein
VPVIVKWGIELTTLRFVLNALATQPPMLVDASVNLVNLLFYFIGLFFMTGRLHLVCYRAYRPIDIYFNRYSLNLCVYNYFIMSNRLNFNQIAVQKYCYFVKLHKRLIGSMQRTFPFGIA